MKHINISDLRFPDVDFRAAFDESQEDLLLLEGIT